MFANCRFLGNQDTIFAAGETSRQLFTDCYIEGTTDFIFGPSTAVFQHCTIHCKASSYITAANTPKHKPFGFVFLDCNVTADTAAHNIYLGRPWRSFAKTAFIRCQLPAQLAAAGWDNWANPANEQTVLYVEYQSNGAGSNTSQRVAWSHQLNAATAAGYTLEKIFNAAGPGTEWWLPSQPKTFEWPAKTK